MITATYWGTRTDMVVGGSYTGDHLVRYDPATKPGVSNLLSILAPYVAGKKGEYRKQMAEMVKEGFLRARVDGKLVDLAADRFAYVFGRRIKLLRLIPEPKTIDIGLAIAGRATSGAPRVASSFLPSGKNAGWLS